MSTAPMMVAGLNPAQLAGGAAADALAAPLDSAFFAPAVEFRLFFAIMAEPDPTHVRAVTCDADAFLEVMMKAGHWEGERGREDELLARAARLLIRHP